MLYLKMLCRFQSKMFFRSLIDCWQDAEKKKIGKNIEETFHNTGVCPSFFSLFFFDFSSSQNDTIDRYVSRKTKKLFSFVCFKQRKDPETRNATKKKAYRRFLWQRKLSKKMSWESETCVPKRMLFLVCKNEKNEVQVSLHFHSIIKYYGHPQILS